MAESLPHIQETPQNETEWFAALAGLARFLRSPEGCPWDRKQTALDFARFVREEVDEYIEALEQGDKTHAAEEFGDSLFVLLASAAAAESEGRFPLQQALEMAHEKMVRRHAHVFDKDRAATPEEAIEAWNKIKAQEKAARGEA